VAFVKDPAHRAQARRILIARYFQPQERRALYSLVGLPIPSDDQIARDAAYTVGDEAANQGREARFRLNIVAAYNYTCALTRYRVMTITGSSIVDAAHIHQFAASRSNDPRNGLALCKNAHWLFDNGLWTLTDDYRVLVAEGHFSEDGAGHKLLHEYHGQRIHLPGDAGLWPNPLHMAWHRKNRFKGP
jgi:putative restriction endonuclease